MYRILSLFLVFFLTISSPVFRLNDSQKYLAAKSLFSETYAGQPRVEVPASALTLSMLSAVSIPVMVGMAPYLMKKLFQLGYERTQIIASYYLYNAIALVFVNLYFLYAASSLNKKKAKETGSQLSLKKMLFLVSAGIISGHLLSIPFKYWALSFSDVITPDAIVRTSPILLVFLSVFTLNEKLSLRKLIGVALVTTGVVSLILTKKSGVMGETTLIGVCIAMLAAFFYAFSDIFNKKIMSYRFISKAKYLLLAYSVGFVFYFIASFLIKAEISLVFSSFVIFLSLVNMYGWFAKLYSMRYLEATLVRCFICTSPLFTFFWVALLNGQWPEPISIILSSLALFITGLFLVVKQHNHDMHVYGRCANKVRIGNALFFENSV